MSFTVYRSSAGSGKTFTLVKEYLCLAFKNPYTYSSILAITFTNKAAAEMKERIIKYLKGLSGENNSEIASLKEIIKSETSLTDEQIKENASKVLSLILHHYADFAVSTIDSFVQRIIRAFAYDMKLPSNFMVDVDDKKILSQAVDILVSKAGNDDNITKALIEFTEAKTDGEKSWDISKDLYTFSKILLDEESLTNTNALKNLNAQDFILYRKKCASEIKTFENEISELGKQAVELILSKGIGIYDFFQGAKGIGKYFEYLRDQRFENIKPNSYVQSTINDDKWFAQKTLSEIIALIESAKTEISSIYHTIQEKIEINYPNYVLQLLIYKNIFQLSLLNEIEKIADEIKKEDGIVHISEFNKRIAAVVQNEPVPFIYERIGERYKNYMIDEFQDTSIMQWQNLIPLVENALSENNTALIVGDGKQAIYRFRNGEVNQFLKLPEIYQASSDLIKEREHSLQSHFQEKHLTSNFRSSENIINFNNELYDYVSTRLSNSTRGIYSNHKQTAVPENKGGFVCVEFINNDTDNITKSEIYCKRVEEIVHELLNDKFKFSDIAILCRFNKDAGDIASFLLNTGLPVISSESILLYKSSSISFLISTLYYLKNRSNQIIRSEMLKYLIDEGLIKNISFSEALSVLKNHKNDEERKLIFYNLLVKNNINFSPEHLKSLPLYELVEELARVFKVFKSTSLYFISFLDVVLNYTEHNEDNINQFLDWWEEQKEKLSVSMPEETEAIRVMSIHKSKGLEFPAVIYAFAEEKMRLTKNNLWIDIDYSEAPDLKKVMVPFETSLKDTKYANDYEEEERKSDLDLINQLYVATTRPSERLYILSQKPKLVAQNSNKDKTLSVPDLLKGFLISTNRWNEEQNEFVFGEKETKKIKKEKSKDSKKELTIDKIISEDWRRKVVLRKSASEGWDVNNPEKNKDWGKLVHFALSKIKLASDANHVIASLVEQGYTDKETSEILLNIINKITTHQDLLSYYSNEYQVMNEAEIIEKENHSYRPDRISIKNNELVIIDYKTGKQKDSDKTQITKYGELISEMGYERIEKYLVYTDTVEVVKVI